mmetsp:Transcript_40870/g.122132  ORF Transcript_40870/g.122132 Transcript_40870/m.122132 type:complete len:399 (+) Transcript_40870:88-1284(+)
MTPPPSGHRPSRGTLGADLVHAGAAAPRRALAPVPGGQLLHLVADPLHVRVPLLHVLGRGPGLLHPEVPPRLQVARHLPGQGLERGEDGDGAHDEGGREEGDEAVLGAGPADPVAVVEHAHGDAQALLLVALREELVLDARGPEHVDPEGLQGVGDVREVQEELVPERDVPAEHLRDVALHGALGVPRLRVAPLGAHLVGPPDLLDYLGVLRVVGVQDGRDAHRAGPPVGLPGKAPEDVPDGVAAEVEELGAMHVLQGRAVVVPKSQIMRRLHQEGVVQPRVPNVMADSTHNEGEPFEVAEDALCCAHVQQPEDAVRDVDRVVPVVVGHLDGIQVTRSCRLHKAGQAALHAAEVPQAKVEDHEAEAGELTLRLFECRRVEVPAVDDAPSKPCLAEVCL